VSPVKYELGFYIPEDDILHSPRRGNLKSYKEKISWGVQHGRRVRLKTVPPSVRRNAGFSTSHYRPIGL
jgi:hypothetical protein